MIEAALRECGGRVYGPSGAAAKLGIPRTTLESKIRSLKINKNRFRGPLPRLADRSRVELLCRRTIVNLTKFVNDEQSSRSFISVISVWPARRAFLPDREGMLRIRRTANGEVVFTLSGRIDRENVAELEALIPAEGQDRRIVIDLKDVTLAGEDGIIFLAQCEAANITLVNCVPYVREWITRQNSGS